MFRNRFAVLTKHHFPALRNIALVLTVALLCGCRDSSAPAPTTIINLYGQVIDGPIAGAVVCVDANGNKQCDSAEPQSLTDAEGAFDFQVSVLETNPPQWPILAVIDAATAKDADDGGKTLEEAGKPSVVLQAMTDGDSSIIVSSLSSLVVNEMEARGISASDARLVVMSTLGLPADSDPNTDFSVPVTDAGQAMKNVAQAAFLVMGHVKAGLERGGAEATSRTLYIASMIEALPVTAYLVHQLDLVRPPVVDLQQKVIAILSSSFSQEGYADTDFSSGLLLNASASLASPTSILGQQFQTVRDIGPAEFDLTCCYLGTGTLDFMNGVSYSRSAYVEGQWRMQPDYLLDLFDLNHVTGEWVRRPVYGKLGDLALPEEGTGLFTAHHTGLLSRYTFRESDISGKSLADVYELYIGVRQFLGETSAQQPQSLIFPDESKITFMSAIPLADNYTLSSYSTVARGPAAPAAFLSLGEMMAYAQTPSELPTEPGSLPHITAQFYAITFDSMADAGTLTFWDAMTFYNPNGGTHILGRGRYEIRTIAGNKILVILHAPPDSIAYGCSTCLPPPSGERIIFADREGSIRSGSVQLANHIQTPAFWPIGALWVDRAYTPIINHRAWLTLKEWLGVTN